MKKKRIYFLMPQFKAGGGNRTFIELGNALVRDNYEAEIIFPNNSRDFNNYPIQEGLKISGIGKIASGHFGKVVNIVKTFKYVNGLPPEDFLILSDPIQCLFSLILLRRKNVFRFVQADDYRIFDDNPRFNVFFLKVYKFLTKISFRAKINFLFNSNFTYQCFKQVSQRQDVPFRVVHPALNSIFKKYESNDRGEEVKVNICLVGRPHPLKGFADFVKLWSENKLQYSQVVDKVYILSDDDLSMFDLADFTLIKPNSDQEIAAVYRKSDIFISTSWFEGFGLPPLEAMASGCAIIVSDCGGVHEFAFPGKNCLMYSPKDIQALHQNLSTLLNQKALRDALRLEGLKTAQHFSWDRSKDQLLHAINYEI